MLRTRLVRSVVLPLVLLADLLLAPGCASRQSARPGGSDGVRGEAAARSGGASRGAYDIACQIGMPSPASHLFAIQIEIANVRDTVVRLQLPVWSPGRYARMDF